MCYETGCTCVWCAYIQYRFKVYSFKTDVPLCGSGCEYVLMSTGTAGVSLIEAPSSGVPGGGFYGSISGFLEEHGLLLTTKLSL